MSYRGYSYLPTAKLTKLLIQTFLFVRLGVGRGGYVQERSLEIAETGSRFDIFWRKNRESLSSLSFNEFKLAINNTCVMGIMAMTEIPLLSLNMCCATKVFCRPHSCQVLLRDYHCATKREKLKILIRKIKVQLRCC